MICPLAGNGGVWFIDAPGGQDARGPVIGGPQASAPLRPGSLHFRIA